MAGSLESNKLISAVLVAGIIASASGVFGRVLYAPRHLEEPVYKIQVPEAAAPAGGGEQAAAADAKPIGVLLASAKPDSGASIAKKCQACHNLDKDGPNKIGPNLWGVVERPVGKHEGFAYSTAMAGKGGNWDYDQLNKFLTSPKDYLPGTKMSFAGLAKEQDRADVISYLRTLADTPAPLPQG